MKTLIVIAGPTASGKTSLAIKLAHELKTEIFNADSRQFYKLMDIGTAKPSPAELSEAKHHFINTKHPYEEYSAGNYERDCLAALNHYFKNSSIAILVGGSGLYIKAVIEGFDDLPKDQNVRQYWKETHAKKGIEYLQAEVNKLDPAFVKTGNYKNPQRLIRAIEVTQICGQPYSQLLSNKNNGRKFTPYCFAITPNRETLYEIINQRVDKMMSAGLVSEVESLLDYQHCNALQTVGYKEIFEYLNQDISLNEAVKLIKQHTRNYAKRQFTWFKNQGNFIPIKSTDGVEVIKQRIG